MTNVEVDDLVFSLENEADKALQDDPWNTPGYAESAPEEAGAEVLDPRELAGFGEKPAPAPALPVAKAPKTEPAPRFKPQTIEELLQTPSLGWIVDGLIERCSVNILYGAEKSFKTFFAINIGLSLGASLPTIWGLKIDPWLPAGRSRQRLRVVYVVGEGGQSFVSERCMAWLLAHGFDTPEKREMVSFSIIKGTMPQLTERSQMEQFAQEVRLNPACKQVDLFIFDTLSRGISGEDENSAKVMSAVQSNLTWLSTEAFAGSTVLVLAHSGKNERLGVRGSNISTAQPDSVLLVQRIGDSLTGRVKVEFQRNGAEGGSVMVQGRMVEVPVKTQYGTTERRLVPVFDKLATASDIESAVSQLSNDSIPDPENPYVYLPHGPNKADRDHLENIRYAIKEANRTIRGKDALVKQVVAYLAKEQPDFDLTGYTAQLSLWLDRVLKAGLPRKKGQTAIEPGHQTRANVLRLLSLELATEARFRYRRWEFLYIEESDAEAEHPGLFDKLAACEAEEKRLQAAFLDTIPGVRWDLARLHLELDVAAGAGYRDRITAMIAKAEEKLMNLEDLATAKANSTMPN